MTHRTVSVAMAALALTVGPHAFAQQPSTNPPVPPTQAAPGPNAGQGQQGAPAGNGAERPAAAAGDRFVLDPILHQGPGRSNPPKSGPRKSASPLRTAISTSGQKLVIALLLEPKGSDTKLLRVTLPLGVALVPGARIVIDEQDAMTAPYVVCLPKNGCMADYKADGDLIEKLKKGRTLAIQAFEKGKPINFTLPLTGFAKAYDGPASDPPT